MLRFCCRRYSVTLHGVYLYMCVWGSNVQVHLSLERMLHERVGLQEKDLLRSQLEAERQAHVATKRHADEVVAGLAQLRNQLEDYQVTRVFVPPCHHSLPLT